MRMTRAPGRLLLVAPLLLAGCVMVPRTVSTYQPECRIFTREMTLQPVQVAALGGCNANACATLLALAAVTGAASMVVSGTIVVVGNIVYWAEKQGQCRPGAEPVTPRAPASTQIPVVP
jgi:hypothetical protein